jgi:hypothetical protein
VRTLLLLAALPACWTGAAPEDVPVDRVAPAEQATAYLRVKLERTPCLGDCSTYTIEIDGTRRIARWTSTEDAGAPSRAVRVTPQDIRALDRQIVTSQFFDRDEHGNMPIAPTCTSDGTTTTCSIAGRISICSDTSHAIVTISRGIRSHTVDYDFCSDNPEIVGLTRLIERLARVRLAPDE